MNPHKKAQLLLKKYQEGKCTPEEVALLHEWYDQLTSDVSGQAGDSQSLQEELRQATWNRIRKQETPVRRMNYRLPAAAAVIGIILLSTLYLFNRHSSYRQDPFTHEFTNNTASVRKVTLSDSTVVWLNAHSCLQWKDDFASSERVVQLDGEGYFEVAKKAAHPFRVLSKNMVTEVLGTAFNIESYAAERGVRIALVSGSVQLSGMDSREMPTRLGPGQIALLGDGPHPSLEVRQGDAGSYGSWTAGGFILQEVPLEDALQRLCHRYGYTLKTNFSGDRLKPISAAYRNDSFEEILAGLLYINHLNYSIQGSVITVY